MSLFGAPQSDFDSDKPGTPSATPQVAKPALSKNSPATIIARGVRLEGEFKSQGDVQIEGEVFGTVETSAMLSIGTEAKVKAGVKAANAVIAGEITGNVTITGKLELKSTAKITGEVVCAVIVVEAGAKMQGNINCGSENSVKPASEPVKTEASIPVAVKPAAGADKSEPATVKSS